jgi:hypothetical protein
MSLARLNAADREVVAQCMRAAVDGPFFPDWEFPILFGLERAEVRSVLATWPGLDESQATVRLAINNSFSNLLGYPHGCEQEWSRFISVSEDEVDRVFDLWRKDA